MMEVWKGSEGVPASSSVFGRGPGEVPDPAVTDARAHPGGQFPGLFGNAVAVQQVAGFAGVFREMVEFRGVVLVVDILVGAGAQHLKPAEVKKIQVFSQSPLALS